MKSQKITAGGRGSRRRYEDACGAAHALDLVGERWALLVMRELMLGPKRFRDLKADLPGISANVLTQRLDGLEAAGVLQRRTLPPPAAVQVYELSPWGYESEPIFQVLGRWAVRSPSHDPRLPLSAVSLLLSFRTMIDPERAGGMHARIALNLGKEAFAAEISHGCIEVSRGEIEDPHFSFAGSSVSLAAAVYGGVPLEVLEAEGTLTVEGNRELAMRFLNLFPLPAKVEKQSA